ncbi:GNAT family N-acetyltransferase [Sorangium sp. So ce295]|uniref:GNAT family N-acetyltransferase n=1 Tax=Sorangium sp. So ce295 TaxID=3133295 RepID=UPI003F60CF06
MARCPCSSRRGGPPTQPARTDEGERRYGVSAERFSRGALTTIGSAATSPQAERRFATARLEERRVEPQAIGRGHGRALLAYARDEARRRGYRVLVIQGDPSAARFYEACGARRVGEKGSASIPGRLLPARSRTARQVI